MTITTTTIKNSYSGDGSQDTFAYSFKNFKIESGINNLMNTSYFTRRATSYPGPGIIPSESRSFYTTLQVKF